MKRLLHIVLLSCTLGLVAHEARAAKATLVITSTENGTENDPEIGCHGIVHGYLILPCSYTGVHELESIWTLPDKKNNVHSRDTVNFPTTGASTVHVWFAFADGGSLLTPINPEADEERLGYNGQWHLKILWDHEPIIESAFNVRCL